MSNLNLRLYGEQIYPNISKYLNKYISPEIEKEDFLNNYKDGLVEIKDITLKEKFNINPQITTESASIGKLKLNIPNETENFSVYLNNMKFSLVISDIKEEELEKILIEDKKELIDDFIIYSISKIEKKDGASFLENLIKSFIDKILNGLLIEINNLELIIKIENFNDSYFIFLIENIKFSDEKGIEIKNISLLYNDKNIKIKVMNQFNFCMDIIHSQKEGISNQINVKINDFKFELNNKIYLEFLKYYNIFDKVSYKKIYLKFKKLIQFKRPKISNGKKEYLFLWHYAIKTVIKLQKYIGYDKQDIFNLLESTQTKIIKKYLDDEKEIENILLIDDIIALKSTKEKVEKKVLENKKGNALVNAFNFFFGGQKEEKEELTEEEKETSDEIYTEQNIINYLNGENIKKSNNLSSVFDKFKRFFSNVSIGINISKLEMILNNLKTEKKQNLFIRGMIMKFNYIKEEFDFNFRINDIGYEKGKSFFNKNNIDKDAITLNRDKTNKINLSFAFDNIQLDENIFIFLVIFYNSIKTKKKNKLFHKKKYVFKLKNENKENEENKIIANIKNFSFINNFTLSNIPSLSIKSIDNKIDISIIKYFINENSFSFTLKINDLYGILLDNFTFSPKKERNKFILHLDTPLKIILSNQSTKSFFMNYLKFQKEISNSYKNEDKDAHLKENDELFEINFKAYKNIDLSNINILDYSLDININNIYIKIYEEKENYQSLLNINNLKLLYVKKDLNIILDNLMIESNHKSTVILYFLGFESSLSSQHQIDLKIKNINNEQNLEKNNKNKSNLKINNEFNYRKLLKEILNKFNLSINNFCFIFGGNSLKLSLNVNKIKVYPNKEYHEGITFSFDRWYLSSKSRESNEPKTIANNDKKTLIYYDESSNIIKGELKSIYFYLNISDIMEIWNNISFLFEKENDNIIFKLYFNLKDCAIASDRFFYSVSNIVIKNFKEDEKKNNPNISNNIFYFKIYQFIMNNETNLKMIEEKELDIEYTLDKENQINIKCRNDLNIKISQKEILSLLLSIKLAESNEEYKKTNSNPINTELKLLIENNVLSCCKDDNFYKKTQISMAIPHNEIRKIFSLKINIIIPKIKLDFCLNNNNDKISEFSIESSKIKINLIKLENIYTQETYNDLTYSLLLGNLNLKYFYNGIEQFNLLTKSKSNLNKEKIYNENQVVIFYSNNKYTININQNDIYVRTDSFLSLFYYFKGSIPIEEMLYNFEHYKNLNINKKKEELKYQINFNNSKFQLSTSFDGKENIFLDINQFSIEYNSNKDGELPYGEYNITLRGIYGNINSKNNVRKLFFTNTKNEFLLIKINFTEEIFSVNIRFDTLFINLSYKDLISFLRAYLLNKNMLKATQKKSEDYLKNLRLNKSNKIRQKDKEKGLINLMYTGELYFKKFCITLIDNSKGSYHPFMKIINENINVVLDFDKSIKSSFNHILYSFNYISCIWEPTIEKTNIICNCDYNLKNGIKMNSINFIIDEVNINISDMAISFTLLTFNNWYTKFEEKRKKFSNEYFNSESSIELKKQETRNIEKITNNQLVNYTGVNLKIIYKEKEIDCQPLQKIELDYGEANESKHLVIIYEKDHIFEIPTENLVTLRHIINNDLSIISENSLSENRLIIISLYSPVIFKNKSIYPLQIEVSNKIFGKALFELNPNSIIGLPLYLIQKNTFFNFLLVEQNNENINYSQDYSLDNILSFSKDSKVALSRIFKEKALILKLINKISNVREIIITTEYSIVNCLPCDLIMYASNKGKLIKKCSQYHLENIFDSHPFIQLSIKTEEGEYISSRIDILKIKNKYKNAISNYIQFFNKSKTFYLPISFKENDEENVLIIYAEMLIHNKSGMKNLNMIYNFDERENAVCIKVSQSLFIISSKIDINDEYIQLIHSGFMSKKIKFSDLIKVVSYKSVTMQNEEYILSFNIKKKVSYINIINNPYFKENITSMVFSIIPKCKIINLLSTKNFVIIDYNNNNNYIIINPLEKTGFQFFRKGPNTSLNIAAYNLDGTYKELIKLKFSTGIYTLTTNDYTFNLEIKKNPVNGCLEVYVVENNIENSEIILENLTNENIVIYQNKFENNIQILEPKEKQALKRYDFWSYDFTVQVGYCLKVFNIKHNEKNNGKTIKFNDKILMLIEENGNKAKATFYLIEKYNNIKTNIIKTTYNLNINVIILSIIGDNEFQDLKLKNYQREEIMLFYFSDFALSLYLEEKSGLLNRDYIKTNINLETLQIYNQIGKIGKFSCVLSNKTSPFIQLENDIDYYPNLNMININKQEIVIGKLNLGIDPVFIGDLFNFFDNILYRMNITNFNINSIFSNKKMNDPKILIKKYSKGKLLLNSIDTLHPEIHIEYELSEIGLNQLMEERMGCSSFYIWAAKGLIGDTNKIVLEKSYQSFNGTIINYFEWLYHYYLNQIEGQITEIGFKGILGNVKNFFTLDLFKDEDISYDVTKNRKREPRIFYGKFKYFKEYSKNETILIRNTYSQNTILKNNYYPLHIIRQKKSLLLFTTLAMFSIDSHTYKAQWNIYYYSIKNAEFNGLNVTVEYNQIIDSKTKCYFECDSNEIAKEVAYYINKETLNNRENILEI